MSSTPQMSRAMTPGEWGLLLVLSAIWGGSFFFNAIALRELPVFTLVVSRVALAALILLAVLRFRGERLPHSGSVWLAFFGMGLLNNAIPFSLIVTGQTHLASGVAAILNASTPLFTVILANALTSDERMSGGKLVGVLVGLLGVAAMVGGEAIQNLGTHVGAQLMCIAAAISYAFAGIFGRRFRSLGVTPMTTATGQVIASSVMLLPVALLVERPWTLPAPGFQVVAAVLAVAAISTALAYVIFFRLLATAGATNLSLVTFLVPVSAILLGTLFLGEELEPRHFVGMALIGVGLAAIDGRPWRLLRGHAADRFPPR